MLYICFVQDRAGKGGIDKTKMTKTTGTPRVRKSAAIPTAEKRHKYLADFCLVFLVFSRISGPLFFDPLEFV